MTPGLHPHQRTNSAVGASGEGTALHPHRLRRTAALDSSFTICPSGVTANTSLEAKDLVSQLAALLADRTPMCTGGDRLEPSANGSVQTGLDDGKAGEQTTGGE